MRVRRIGFTPVKGGHHQTHRSVMLRESGPWGDRAFCLVDLSRDRCLRTIENPTLLRTRSEWDGTVLSVRTPGGSVSGEPGRAAEVRTVDYWGRTARVELVDGPWAAAYSEHLGREVVLASTAPGAVVYSGSVTLVLRRSLDRLAEMIDAPVDGARFRATFEADADEWEPRVDNEWPENGWPENGWLGRRVRLGQAEIEVRALVPRCTVIDLDPRSGVRDLALMKALAGVEGRRGEVTFGLSAEVTVPGTVRTGDEVSLEPSSRTPCF